MPATYRFRILGGEFSMLRFDSRFELNPGEDWPQPFFLAHSKDELSLLIRSEFKMDQPPERSEPGWIGFLIDECLDFSLVGVVASISGILAEANISLMAMSTFDTDYFFVRKQDFASAREVLEEAGYAFVEASASEKQE